MNEEYKWYRLLHSGQKVSYENLPLKQVVALATALDEWEHLVHKRYEEK